MKRDVLARFALDEGVIYLNHGSFGACPRAVLEVQAGFRARMERQPVQFFARDLEGLLDAARARLAAFVGADPSSLAFVPNATAAVNAVVSSLRLSPGDELLTTDHAYNACKNVLDRAADESGAVVVVAPLPMPLTSDGVVTAVLDHVTALTRLVLLDHVTSPTGAVLPVERIVPALEKQGVPVLVDGAHAPGMVPLDLRALAASYYTGNCHKWMCAPKGAGFLCVRDDVRPSIRPAITSHGANSPRTDRSRFHLEFDWIGTVDPTAFLSVPAAIDFCESAGDVRGHNRALALEGGRVLEAALGAVPCCAEDMCGSMRALAIGDGDALALHDALIDEHHIEVPIIPWPDAPQRLVRISAQIYNERADYEALAAALSALGAGRSR